MKELLENLIGEEASQKKTICFKLLVDIAKCEDIRSDCSFRDYVKLIEDTYRIITELENSQKHAFVDPFLPQTHEHIP